MKNLVLVESPSKAKTIEKYLGKDFHVMATYGHIRDLPTKEIGIDFEHDFEPKYVRMKGKSKVITNIKTAYKNSNELYLAVDPDREGEAIGWHIATLLGAITPSGRKKSNSKKEVKRISFHEITKEAVEEALQNPRSIDMNLVDAQQARRIVDRIVGYKLSPLLWKKVRYGLSAGRVQSVAVRMIVDRERLRDAFVPDEYWEIFAIAKKGNQAKQIEIKYLKVDKYENEKDLESKGYFRLNYIGNKNKKLLETDSKKVINDVKDKTWVVTDLKEKESNRYPSTPFTTSTLQQAALNRLGFTAKRTMGAAQKLYEKGLITYMRTDSMNMSASFITKTRKFIKSVYGENYLSDKERRYKTRSKNAQEAHEAIRPTDASKMPGKMKLEGDMGKLYDLIWRRAVATQMKEAKMANKQLIVEIEREIFEARSSQVKFDGYLKVYNEKVTENELPDLEVGDNLNVKSIYSLQKFTKPPARYTEATLIKAMEAEGIGRPSTYASIISVIQTRGYTAKEGKYFFPTDVGYVVNDILVNHFPEIVDLKFTAKMENDLDDIANGELEWVPMIKDFYTPFEKNLEKKSEELKKADLTVLGKSDKKCPECGGAMVIKLGKYGKFYSCKKFPDCKGMLPFEEEKVELDKIFFDKYQKAPKAEDGSEMVLKKGRFGMFWSHKDYPDVKETKPLLLKEKCPECDCFLVERKGKWGKSFIGCSNYPNCKFIKKAGKGQFRSKAAKKKTKKK